MAKDNRIVAGVLGDSKYYYASDGSIVDEDGKPAPAKFAALFPPMPEKAPEPVKETKSKKTRRKLKELAGKLGNSKYYYDNEGNVVDEQGQPVSERLANSFGKRQAISEALPKVEPKKQTDMIDNNSLRVINSEVSKAIRGTEKLTLSHEIIQSKMPTMFDAFNDVVKTLSDQNDTIVQRLIQKNQDFQDKVVESMTGIPSPTKAGGAKPRKMKVGAVGGSKAAKGAELKVKDTRYRETRKKEVEERARRIEAIRTSRNIAAVAGGIAGGVAAGIGAGALISAITPAPTGGGVGGEQPSAAPAGTAAGGMTRLTTRSGKSFDIAAAYAPNFKGFIEELEATGYVIKSIGGYANRNIAGTGKKSYHSLGAAIDINPSTNPHLFDGRLQTDMPSNIGAIAAKYGLGWGGNWSSSKDAMHFSIAAGEGGSIALDRNSVAPLPGSPQAQQTQTARASGGGGTGPMAAPAGPSTGTGGAGSIQAPGGVSGGSAGAGAAPGTIEKINEIGAGYNVVQLADGSIEHRAGARNWRNNNPGNLEYGSLAKSMGAIGSDGRFAIFPSYEMGRAAKEKLLFESGRYKGMTIQQAIYKYAPPNENNSANYASTVAAAAGVPVTAQLESLSSQQKEAMLNAMEKVEGFKSGRVTKVSEATKQVASASASQVASASASGPLPNIGEKNTQLASTPQTVKTGTELLAQNKPVPAPAPIPLPSSSGIIGNVPAPASAPVTAAPKAEGTITTPTGAAPLPVPSVEKVTPSSAEPVMQKPKVRTVTTPEGDIQKHVTLADGSTKVLSSSGEILEVKPAASVSQSASPAGPVGPYTSEPQFEYGEEQRLADIENAKPTSEKKKITMEEAFPGYKKNPDTGKLERRTSIESDFPGRGKKEGEPLKAYTPSPEMEKIIAAANARSSQIDKELDAEGVKYQGGKSRTYLDAEGNMVSKEEAMASDLKPPRVSNPLTAASEQNAMQEYTQPPAVQTVIVNNNRTNNVTKTVYQDSSLPTLDRGSNNRGDNNSVSTGAF
jgi:hypothetical protein